MPPLRLATYSLAVVFFIPLLVLVLSWSSIDASLWSHLLTNLLSEIVLNTIAMLLGVGFGVLALGVSLAYLVSFYEFRGRAIFEWLLVLPLAIPPYVTAYVFIGLWDASGSMQVLWRDVFGGDIRQAPSVRHLGGLIAVLSLSLYPYVYLLARNAFCYHQDALVEAAQTLGLNPRQAFFKVTIPLAKVGIITGLSLALFEALADFGAVSVFNIDTFTTAIYKVGLSFFDLKMAAQLASLLCLFVLVVKLASGRRAKSTTTRKIQATCKTRRPLTPVQSTMVVAGLVLFLLIAVVLPIGQLGVWVASAPQGLVDGRFWSLVFNTVVLAGLAALMVLVLSLVIAGAANQAKPGRWFSLAKQMCLMGYALPGSVLAICLMLMFTQLDNAWLAAAKAIGWTEAKPFLMGSVLALLVAYSYRFLLVGFSPVHTSLTSIKPIYHESALILGAKKLSVFQRIDYPLLRPGLLTAFLMVFVEVMKEMPATLLMRPFGWDTLAVRIFEMTSEGEWERAALPSVILVIVSLIPVSLLMRDTKA